MRRIRDLTDPSLFGLFNDRVNFYTVPQYKLQVAIEGGGIEHVSVLSGGHVGEADVTVRVGHQIEVRDLNLQALRPDRNVSDIEVREELTRAHMACLSAFTQSQPLVLFLDAAEKADEMTRCWIREELLERVRDDQIPNLFVILAGREPLDLGASFFGCVESVPLKPFELEHILTYLEVRGLPKMPEIALFILANSGGNPLEIATRVNAYLQLRKQMEGKR
jgi:hypothetical protein